MTVFLVGAGPGDPGLLTVRGRDLLAEADVVLYDALVDVRLLGLTASGCSLVDVGKAARGHGRDSVHTGGTLGALGPKQSTSQECINELLVFYGRQADTVVRLKGGDPFVFGRGGEEALALAEAGIPFEIVPGVSSAMAAPAYAGIPVTHRGLATSVTIVTGHEAPGKSDGDATTDWAKLATVPGTLVILMGVSQFATIAAQLIAGGRAADTPAAAVEQGTTMQQRVVSGTLGTLPRLIEEAGVRSPAAIVVGDVVRLREHLAWYAPPRELKTSEADAALCV